MMGYIYIHIYINDEFVVLLSTFIRISNLFYPSKEVFTEVLILR